MGALDQLLAGGIAVGSLVAGLFFFRFWHQTRDSFFLCFAVSFWLESVNRVLLGLFVTTTEDNASIYLLRLVAYGLILWAVWNKNRPRT